MPLLIRYFYINPLPYQPLLNNALVKLKIEKRCDLSRDLTAHPSLSYGSLRTLRGLGKLPEETTILSKEKDTVTALVDGAAVNNLPPF
ncbi:MAG: hypothetical protein CV087_11200 [Candidatus Brocadia sp. WS118]|nr:MAG: hypothetical protein CV087_11200 [Candidatus Brocadia sp. WS118]